MSDQEHKSGENELSGTELLMQEDPDEIVDQVEEFIANRDGESINKLLDSLTPADRAMIVSRLNTDDEKLLFELVSSEVASWLVREVPESNVRDVFEDLEPERIAEVLDELRSDQQADLLAVIAPERTESVLGSMDNVEVGKLRDLLAFPSDTAGGLMITEFLQYDQGKTTGQVLDDLRNHGSDYSDYEVQYAYIVDEQERLTGVLRMRDLLFNKPTVTISDLMIPKPVSLPVEAKLPELESFFDDNGYIGVPVIDSQGRMLGVIRRSAVLEASEKEANKILLKLSGIVGGEEFRSMSIGSRSGRRLSFLSINIVLNIIAASVIAFFTDTLEAVIALAVFLPIISDMSGCSGNQAVAVSIRELTLGLVRPNEFFRVFLKESAVGLINGIALGALIGIVAFLWQGNAMLGVVVGAAMAMNTLVAVCVGGLVPLLVRRLRLDPALVSGPILTTVTDMCGFFLVLGMATMFLSYLV